MNQTDSVTKSVPSGEIYAAAGTTTPQEPDPEALRVGVGGRESPRTVATTTTPYNPIPVPDPDGIFWVEPPSRPPSISEGGGQSSSPTSVLGEQQWSTESHESSD